MLLVVATAKKKVLNKSVVVVLKAAVDSLPPRLRLRMMIMAELLCWRW